MSKRTLSERKSAKVEIRIESQRTIETRIPLVCFHRAKEYTEERRHVRRGIHSKKLSESESLVFVCGVCFILLRPESFIMTDLEYTPSTGALVTDI